MGNKERQWIYWYNKYWDMKQDNDILKSMLDDCEYYFEEYEKELNELLRKD